MLVIISERSCKTTLVKPYFENGTAPKYMCLCSYFRKPSDTHRYNTRGGATKIKIKAQQCNIFFFTGIQEWNQLPDHIKSLQRKVQFKSKKAIKRHFYQQHFNKSHAVKSSNYIWAIRLLFLF